MDKKLQAEWASNLLKDDFFKKVMDDLKNQQISVIINTNRDEVDEREAAYNHIKTLDLVLGHLQGIAAETKIQEKKWKIL
jgi:RNA binding exosome subunit